MCTCSHGLHNRHKQICLERHAVGIYAHHADAAGTIACFDGYDTGLDNTTEAKCSSALALITSTACSTTYWLSMVNMLTNSEKLHDSL